MRSAILAMVVFVASGLFVGPSANAQKVHALVVADLSPAAGWGVYLPNLTMDVTNMYVFFFQNLPEANIVYRSIEYEQDQESDPNALLRDIQMLSPGSNDTVFVYFTGHGSVDDQGHHLALARGKLYRQTIIDAIQKKNPRLTVLVTDCCNSRSDGKAFAPAAPFVEEPPTITPLFRSLLVEPRGLVDINSCAPGESAFFTASNPEQFQLPGSIFTKEFCDWAFHRVQQRKTWDDLVRDVSLQVHSSFLSNYPRGAQVAKGQIVQNQQTVYAVRYPGKPENQGPRSGIVARDFDGQGVVILEVTPGTPATQVYDIANKQFVSLRPQQVLISINGSPIQKLEDLMKSIGNAPQISRIGVRDARQGDREYLIRLKY